MPQATEQRAEKERQADVQALLIMVNAGAHMNAEQWEDQLGTILAYCKVARPIIRNFIRSDKREAKRELAKV